MFSQISRQFLQKFKSLLSPVSQRFLSLKIARPRQPVKFRKFKCHGPKASTKKQNDKPKIYAREKITKIYNILKYSTWDSALEQLENLPIKWDSFTVNQVLKAHPPMEKAWLFFNWAPGREKFKHDQYTYTTMLDIFGEARRISSMMYVWEQMKVKGVKIDVVTYTSLMHWVSNVGDIDGASELWKEMRAKGCRPTVVTYTAYMKILLDHKRVNEAAKVYREMLDSGLSPNCQTYTVLADYLASSGKSAEALEIFRKMQDAGVQPDKATCNILIETFSQSGEIWAIMKILEYMKENFLVLRYPIYQKALETFKIYGECDMLLRQVNRHFTAEQSIEGTDKSAAKSLNNGFEMENSLIQHLMSKQNLAAVDSMLSDMMDKCVQLETSVISKIIEANCAQGRKSGALMVYEYSVKSGNSIDRIAYLALLGLFTRTNSFQKAVEIVGDMVKQGLSLGTHLNSSLIHRLGRCREIALASRVFDLLPEEERKTPEYTALIGAYFSSGDADRGLETFEIMKSRGIDVALGTYCVLLAGLEKCGKVRELEYYTKEKRTMVTKRSSQMASLEKNTCDLLFTGDFMLKRAR